MKQMPIRRFSWNVAVVAVLILGVLSLSASPSMAQIPLSVSWPQIGSNNVPGSLSVTGTGPSAVYTIRGNGDDIWNTRDEGFFAYEVPGQANSIAIQATFRWESTSNSPFSRVGLMIRENPTDPSSRFFHIASYGGSDRYVQSYYRNDTGGQATLAGCSRNDLADDTQEVSLRLIFDSVANLVTGQYSLDLGQTWIDSCSHRFSPTFNPETVGYGVAITSFSDDTSEAIASFRNFSIMNTVNWPQQGSVNIPGSISMNPADPTSFIVRGNGDDIWNTRDEGFFAYQQNVGSGNVVASGKFRWESTNNSTFSRSGIMVRENPNDPSSRFFHFATYGGSNRFLQAYYRNDTGGSATLAGCSQVDLADDINEVSLRIVYDSSTEVYTGQYSLDDGATWVDTCSHKFTPAFNQQTVGYGIALTSNSDDTHEVVTSVSDFSVENNSIFDGSVSWPQIGSNNVPGFVNVTGDGADASYQIGGNGNDILGTQDEGFYVYKNEEGNVAMEARVVWNDPGHQGTDKWPKLGLMARENATDPTSSMFFVDFLGGGDRYVSIIWRDGTGVAADGTSIDIADNIWEVRFRLTRDALSNTFTGEYSLDNGGTWQTIGSYTFTSGFKSLTSTYGLAITSFDENHVAVGTVNQLTITSNSDFPGIIQNGRVTIQDLVSGNANGTYQNLTITALPSSPGIALNGLVNVTSTGITGTFSSTLNLVGLIMSVNTMTIADNTLRMDTSVGLPPFLGGLTQRAIVVADQDGVRLEGGRFEVPNLQVAKLGVKNGFVELFPSDNIYGGGGDFALPGIRGAIGGSFQVQNDQLNNLLIQRSGLNIFLGATGLRLDSVRLNGTNLSNLSQLAFGGSVRILGGPSFPVGGRSVNTFSGDMGINYQPSNGYTNIYGNAKIFNIETANANLDYRPPNSANLSAGVNFGGVFNSNANIGFSDGNVSGGFSGSLSIPSSVSVVGGWQLGSVNAQIIDNGRKFRGSASVTITPSYTPPCVGGCCCEVCLPLLGCSGQVCTPRYCPPPIPAVGHSFTFEFSTTGGIAFARQAPHFPEWEVPYNQPFSLEDGGTFQFMTDWKRIDKVGNAPGLRTFSISPYQEPVTTLTVPEGVPAAIFRVTYLNPDVTGIEAILARPNQTELRLEDGPLPDGFEDGSGYARWNPNTREAYFFLFNPPSGDYVLTLPDVSSLGDYSVELLVQDEEPYVDLIAVTPLNEAGLYEIDWLGPKDSLDELNVQFYLDSDQENLDGFLIDKVTTDEFEFEGETFIYYQIDVSQESIQPGWYFVLMTIDNGSSGVVHDYSNAPIFVSNDNHPAPIDTIDITPIDGGFEIDWEPIDDSITSYTVLYTLEDNIGTFENFISVDASETRYTVTGLQNGVPVLATVVGNRDDGLASAARVIQRVIPTAGFGLTPAIIGSKPQTDATATFDYAYFPRVFDGDFVSFQKGVAPSEFDPAQAPVLEPSFRWELLESPSGMTIDAEFGYIAWTPTEEQVGIHNVALALFNEAEGDNAVPFVQEFTIDVFPSDDLSGFEGLDLRFLSPPVLTAFHDTTYEYKPVMLIPDGWEIFYDLVAGPAGMMNDLDTGIITWEVPDDAIGEFVSVEAILFDGEFEYVIPQTFFLHTDEETTASTGIEDAWELHQN